MAEKRKANPKFTTEAGTFRYPKITEPDYGNEKYPKPDGEYSVQVIFREDSPEAQTLIAQLTPHYEEALAAAAQQFKDLPVAKRKEYEKQKIKGPVANALYGVIYDKTSEEPTGEIFFKATMKASGVYKKGPKEGQTWKRAPVIFDASGNRMIRPPAIWGGTVGKVAVETSGYYISGTNAAGLKLNLVGVQVINLVSQGSASAESMGFSREDGGYQYEAPTAEADAVPTAAGEDDADGSTGDF